MLSTKLKRRIKILWTHLQGINRYEVVKELINKNNFKSYAEIGVWKGLTTRYVMKKCNLDNVICVDNYISNNELEGEDVEEAKKAVEDLKQNSKVLFIEKSSEEASKEVKDNSVDLIFIDANHTYEDVKKDIKLWYPKVKEGGILCGHDYKIQWYGVVKAVSEAFYPINLEFGDVWWIRKVPSQKEKESI